MSSERKENVLQRGDHKYCVYYLTGVVHLILKDTTVVLCEGIIDANIKPIRIEKRIIKEGNIDLSYSVYKTEPTIIVFDNYYGEDAEGCAQIFQEKFKDKLNSKYVLGRFNLFEADRVWGETFIRSRKSFSVALFGKSKQEILDFAVDFLDESDSNFAFIKGNGFEEKTVEVVRNDTLEELAGMVYVYINDNLIL